MRQGLQAVILAAMLLVSAHVNAQFGIKPRAKTSVLTIVLDSSVAEPPDHVCIVWPQGRADDTSGRETLQSLALERLRPLVADGLADDLWAFRPWAEIEGSAVLAGRDHIAAAVRALAVREAPAGVPGCDGEHPSCHPQLSARSTFDAISVGDQRVTRTNHIYCAPNESRRSAEQRVLVITLNTHQLISPTISQLRLDGSLVSLFFDGEVKEDQVLHARIAGGDYATANQSSAASNYRVTLALEPRCSTSTVELSAMKVLGIDSIEVKFSGGRCEAVLDAGSFDIRLPPSSAHRKRLTATAKEHVFVARWTSRRPPATLRAGFDAFSFSWRPSCELRGQRCPDALLSETGTTCETIALADRVAAFSTLGTCSYRCELGESNLAVSLPATVQFTHVSTRANDKEIVWDAQLSFAGQTLKTPHTLEGRWLDVALPRLIGDNVEWRRLDAVEITLPDGTTHELSRATPVSAPRVRCGDTLEYRFRGQRYHPSHELRLEGGTVAIPHPEKDEATLSIGIAAEAGIGFDNERGGHPVAELALRVPVYLRPWASRFALEIAAWPRFHHRIRRAADGGEEWIWHATPMGEMVFYGAMDDADVGGGVAIGTVLPLERDLRPREVVAFTLRTRYRIASGASIDWTVGVDVNDRSWRGVTAPIPFTLLAYRFGVPLTLKPPSQRDLSFFRR